jgi:hypothetical protein
MSRRFQFSLKSLMVLVLVAAAFFAGMAIQRRETERVRMMAELERVRAEEDRALAAASEQHARIVAEELSAELVRAQSTLEQAETTNGD